MTASYILPLLQLGVPYAEPGCLQAAGLLAIVALGVGLFFRRRS